MLRPHAQYYAERLVKHLDGGKFNEMFPFGSVTSFMMDMTDWQEESMFRGNAQMLLGLATTLAAGVAEGSGAKGDDKRGC